MSEMNIPSMSGQDVSQSLDWTMFTDARIVTLHFFLNIFWIALDSGDTKALAISFHWSPSEDMISLLLMNFSYMYFEIAGFLENISTKGTLFPSWTYVFWDCWIFGKYFHKRHPVFCGRFWWHRWMQLYKSSWLSLYEHFFATQLTILTFLESYI